MSDNPVLKTPGEMISEARQAHDLTIAQLSERTKIPPPVLTALELDEYHKISGPLYIKSFLRTCASDLDLDPLVVLGLYNKISGEQQSGSGSPDMVWEEEAVEVSRVGLPWPKIILSAGFAAILIGAGLFIVRGCQDRTAGPDTDPAGVSVPERQDETAAVVPVDSVTGDDSSHGSLIPSRAESQLRDLAAAAAGEPGSDDEDHDSNASGLPDTLALGWVLNPPAVEAERKPTPLPEPETALVVEESNPTVPADVPEEKPAAIISEKKTREISEEPTVTITAAAVVQEVETQPAQVDSAWPLVLGIVCQSPQEILVKRDNDRNFSQVKWPTAQEPVQEVPEAGFEAGRAYRQGNRLVVYWGAEDHFSLKVARVREVEVSINGRVRDVGKLRPDQELILDAHSAGTPQRR